eukprot:1094262-Rhodomonas_salina.2
MSEASTSSPDASVSPICTWKSDAEASGAMESIKIWTLEPLPCRIGSGETPRILDTGGKTWMLTVEAENERGIEAGWDAAAMVAEKFPADGKGGNNRTSTSCSRVSECICAQKPHACQYSWWPASPHSDLLQLTWIHTAASDDPGRGSTGVPDTETTRSLAVLTEAGG